MKVSFDTGFQVYNEANWPKCYYAPEYFCGEYGNPKAVHSGWTELCDCPSCPIKCGARDGAGEARKLNTKQVAEDKVNCPFCGSHWTYPKINGKHPHKHSCPHRMEPFCQSHKEGCPEKEVNESP